jgi:hypothetical protein
MERGQHLPAMLVCVKRSEEKPSCAEDIEGQKQNRQNSRMVASVACSLQEGGAK